MALPAILLLEGEEPFSGRGLGAEGRAHGVMAVSAVAAGFPDLITDPSYTGKLMCFTYPHVGTAGMVPGDLQSDAVAVRGVVGREIGRFAANRLGVESMQEFLLRNNIPAMEGVDTRSVTEIVARRGLVRAVMGTGDYANAERLATLFDADPETWAVDRAGTAGPYEWTEGAAPVLRFRVVVVDLGVKKGFLRRLAGLGCTVKVVPSDWSAEKILAEKPDGVVLSAGNGVPDTREEALPAAAALLGKVPLWGVGVGAGLVAAAAGARTLVNGRGHMGVHPVGRNGEPSGEMASGCTEFWIEGESLPGAGLEETHFHLNDRSVMGFRCRDRRVMGTMFHPEAEPGPRDSLYLFERFGEMMGS